MSRPAYSSKANELSPYILIQPYRCSLTIGKDIIKSLGYPKHVCLRINESNRSFAIIPCEANDVMSFKIPEKLFTDSKCVFRINSKSFLISLVLKYNLDPACKLLIGAFFKTPISPIITSGHLLFNDTFNPSIDIDDVLDAYSSIEGAVPTIK